MSIFLYIWKSTFNFLSLKPYICLKALQNLCQLNWWLSHMETDNSSISSCTWREVISSASCKYIPLSKISSICLEGPQISFVSRFYWDLNVMDGDSRISHLTWFYGVTQCNFIFYSVHEMQVKLSFHRHSERERGLLLHRSLY